MLVLALDTSTPSVTAGVVRLREPHEIIAALEAGAVLGDAATRPGALLAQEVVTDPFAHAERLMPLALAALSKAGGTLRDLAGVVVGVGPGPFTGLRVGVATAVALGDGLGIPVHGIPSHDAVATSMAPLSGDLLVVTDARRREVYLSVYQADGSRVLGPLVHKPAGVADLLSENGLTPTYITGAGTALLDSARTPSFDPIRVSAGVPGAGNQAATRDEGGAGRSETAEYSLALGLVERAAVPLLTGAVPGPLKPLYLRRPDATEPGARKSVLGR
ncbi:tRNA (adenosine(37)-N6)-threonylcarbamoyltransferase complex dimerization subunit type 1 TsaB [Nakamurella sp. GG22]